MNKEISERLREELYARVTFADNLKPALALASEQLELLCPAVMGVTTKGLVATLATTIPRGTWLMVLANPRKLLTMQVALPPERITWLQIVHDCVEGAVRELGRPVREADILQVISVVADKHGGKPGKKTPQIDQEICVKILGLLFSNHSHAERSRLLHGVEEAISADVCPLHVGLVGRGSKRGSMCGVWPLGLPFAPYVESLGL